MIIFSGHQPGNTGVGRLMSCLVQQAATHAQPVEVVCQQPHRGVGRELKRLRLRSALASARNQRDWWRRLDDARLVQADPVVLIHPQSLGFPWCQALIEKRSRHTWMYVVDSSFFCIRSYNHIPGEAASCLRCLGGNWSAIGEMGCQPYPEPDASAPAFVRQLRRWIAEGQVRCLVQTETQADLIRAHCGDQAVVRVVGLWTADMDHLPDARPGSPAGPGEYDVVYHAAGVPAKGCRWAIELARRCPQLKFLFPCRRKDVERAGAPATQQAPQNIDFAPLTWETGLGEAVAQARVVLVPSLWSATIEGALVKSLVSARAVAVVQEPTAYSRELPEGLLLRLPREVDPAAEALVRAVERRWEPDSELRRAWVAQFRRENRRLLDRLILACQDGDAPRQSKHVA